jgi:DNA-binding NarL/FixJ family response regulator
VPADAVFLDVLAPGRMNATDFLRTLRREYPDARVVAIAGRPSFAGVDPLSVAKGLGATRTMRIPLTREQVLQAVEDVRP